MADQAIALYFESIETQQSSQGPEQKKLRALCGNFLEHYGKTY